ncbi:MAG: hypothetical protein IJI57_04485 [Flexilinea sp.]|nr:hypothetical protein [Flexilinea sp.]
MKTAYLDGEIFIIERILLDDHVPVVVGHYLDGVYDEAYLENIEYREE